MGAGVGVVASVGAVCGRRRRRGAGVDVVGVRIGVGSVPTSVAGAAGVTMFLGSGCGEGAGGAAGCGAGADVGTPWNCMLRRECSVGYILIIARCVSFESRMRGFTSTRSKAGLIANAFAYSRTARSV